MRNILKANAITGYTIHAGNKEYEANLPGKIPFYSNGFFTATSSATRQTQMRLDKNGLRVCIAHNKGAYTEKWTSVATIVWKNTQVTIWANWNTATPYLSELIERVATCLINGKYIETIEAGKFSVNSEQSYNGDVRVNFSTTYASVELWLK